MSVFMGEAAPHAWPIHAAELETLGIPVEVAEPAWSTFVDDERRAQPKALDPWNLLKDHHDPLPAMARILGCPQRRRGIPRRHDVLAARRSELPEGVPGDWQHLPCGQGNVLRRRRVDFLTARADHRSTDEGWTILHFHGRLLFIKKFHDGAVFPEQRGAVYVRRGLLLNAARLVTRR
jgi:hypothetical protein